MKKIAILSVPRSGSTWVGQIFNSSPQVLYRFQPNFAYSFPYVLRQNSNRDEINNFYQRLEACDDPFVTGRLSISGKQNLQFQKHPPYQALVWKEVHYLFLAKTLLKNSNSIIIALVRSPLSVIASWIKIPKEFDPNWDLKEEWKNANKKNRSNDQNYFGYGKWKEVMELFESLKNAYPKRLYLLSYKDLLLDKTGTIKNVFTFCGLDMGKEVTDFIHKSSSVNQADAYSVYKDKRYDDGWKQHLPDYIIDEIMNDPDFIQHNKKYLWV